MNRDASALGQWFEARKRSRFRDGITHHEHIGHLAPSHAVLRSSRSRTDRHRRAVDDDHEKRKMRMAYALLTPAARAEITDDLNMPIATNRRR